MVSARMVRLYPRLANLKVRRTWKGCYPQTPDGSPILGRTGVEGFLVAVGMCGQGFMLGPAREVLARLVTGGSTREDEMVLEAMSLHRDFSGVEALK